MIDDIQISSGSGKTVKRDSRLRVRSSINCFLSSSIVVPKQYSTFQSSGSVPDDWKVEYCFGTTIEELKKQLIELRTRSRESLFTVFPEPDEIWISSIMTYWWESTRDTI